MKRVHLCSITVRIFPVVVFGLFFAGVEHAAPALGNKPSGNSQSPNPKPGLQSKVQKLANPLNDLLAEAQQDIDKSNFEAAIAPLRKVIADQPEFAYAHFQLAYVYTALKKTDEARAEYGRTIAIGTAAKGGRTASGTKPAEIFAGSSAGPLRGSSWSRGIVRGAASSRSQ